MKKSIVSALSILTAILLLISSCKKETRYMNDAVITGPDLRACICCGGLMISLTGETKPYIGNFRLISNNGVDIGITDRDKFPIYVKVDWKEDTTNICNHIVITRIARR